MFNRTVDVNVGQHMVVRYILIPTVNDVLVIEFHLLVGDTNGVDLVGVHGKH